jgi:hypothetical protein
MRPAGAAARTAARVRSALPGGVGESNGDSPSRHKSKVRGTGMTRTGYSSFGTTLHKTNHILRQIEESCGWQKERRDQSYNVMRAVLHAMRDRLTVDETAHFAAQLPSPKVNGRT